MPTAGFSTTAIAVTSPPIDSYNGRLSYSPLCSSFQFINSIENPVLVLNLFILFNFILEIDQLNL